MQAEINCAEHTEEKGDENGHDDPDFSERRERTPSEIHCANHLSSVKRTGQPPAKPTAKSNTRIKRAARRASPSTTALKRCDKEAVRALLVRPDARRAVISRKICVEAQGHLLEISVLVQKAGDHFFVLFTLDGTS